MIRKVVLLLIVLLMSVNVTANSGPSTRYGDKNTPLAVMEDTEVEILHESLTYDIYNVQGYEFYADVVVEYDLFNNSDSTESITALFPRMLSWEGRRIISVYLNDEEISNTLLLMSGEYDNFNSLVTLVNYYLDNPTYEPNYSQKNLSVNLFDLDIPPGNSLLRIEYDEIAFGRTNRFIYTPLSYEGYFEYIFDPAKHWKDFGSIDITLNMHMDGFKFVNLPKEFYKDKATDYVSYKASFNELPDENLKIEFKEKKVFLPVVSVLIVLGLIIKISRSKTKEELKRQGVNIIRATFVISNSLARILTVVGFIILLPNFLGENIVIFMIMLLHLISYTLIFMIRAYVEKSRNVLKNVFRILDIFTIVVGYLFVLLIILMTT